jgi:hypothetical protein
VPVRPGTFNANFAPDLLESFKAVCIDRGERYTKILEKFAQLYVQSNGEVLEKMTPSSSSGGTITNQVQSSSSINTRGDTVMELLERTERLESDDREFASAFEMLMHRVEALEQKLTP